MDSGVAAAESMNLINLIEEGKSDKDFHLPDHDSCSRVSIYLNNFNYQLPHTISI